MLVVVVSGFFLIPLFSLATRQIKIKYLFAFFFMGTFFVPSFIPFPFCLCLLNEMYVVAFVVVRLERDANVLIYTRHSHGEKLNDEKPQKRENERAAKN